MPATTKKNARSRNTAKRNQAWQHLKVNMHQALVFPKPKNIAPLPHAGNEKSIHGAVSVGIESLRHEAARLRATAQAKLTLSGTRATLHNPSDLLQQAAILDRGADVLALTNWN